MMDRIAIATEFPSEEACLQFIEAMRWPEGVRCPDCGCEKLSKFQTKAATRGVQRASGAIETVTLPPRCLYQCRALDCGLQFSAISGTLFHDTHLPLRKWFFAVALLVNARKQRRAIGARQLARDLQVTYKTAWYLTHRIREAIER